ncbi:MAG: hypothetical protein ACFFCQ_08820 [Promethearchaeota archaeon]
MNVHVHIAAAGIVIILLDLIIPLKSLELFCIIIGSIALDLDFFVTKKFHRKMPTHFPFLWIPITLLGLFYYPLFCLGFAALVHLLLDCFDWGIYLFGPFSKKLYFQFIEIPQGTRTLSQYIKRLYKTPVPLFIEISTTSIFFVFVLFNLHTLILLFGIYCIVACTTWLYILWVN